MNSQSVDQRSRTTVLEVDSTNVSVMFKTLLQDICNLI